MTSPMKIVFRIVLVLAWVVFPSVGWADAATRNTQVQLKNRGFYYGEIDGVGGPETEAALRRFQIRQGLKVTGTLTEETSRNLNRPPSASAPVPGGQAAAQYQEADQNFLESTVRSRPAPTPEPRAAPTPPRYPERVEQREERYSPPGSDFPYEPREDERFAVPPPVEFAAPRVNYADVFLGTMFEDAPRELQRDILQDAQARLARLRYYQGEIDGLPGPITEEAIARFQDDGRQRVTGRLDPATLSDLGLISSRRRSRSVEFSYQSGGQFGVRVYRGIPIR